jgi:cytochrome oxidase Cu insertion factor (SCO1/SenC/PrrC family)
LARRSRAYPPARPKPLSPWRSRGFAPAEPGRRGEGPKLGEGGWFHLAEICRRAALAAALVLVVAAGFSHAHDPARPGPEAAVLESARLPARPPAFDYDAPAPGTYELPPLREAVDGAVLDVAGTKRRLVEAFAGKVVLLSFIYTRCADTNGCPVATAALADIAEASADDPELARSLKLVSLSFDPEHDTPAALAAFAAPLLVSASSRRADWTFLTTASERELEPILAGYDQLVVKNLGPDKVFDGTFEHLLRVYLIDRTGQVRNVYGVSFLDPRLLIADVKTLLLEEQTAKH